jgi:hypothetical protein
LILTTKWAILEPVHFAKSVDNLTLRACDDGGATSRGLLRGAIDGARSGAIVGKLADSAGDLDAQPYNTSCSWRHQCGNVLS